MRTGCYFGGFFVWAYFQGDLGAGSYLGEGMNQFCQWVGVYLVWVQVGVHVAYGGVV